MRYADVIIDNSAQDLDKSFQYVIPPEMEEQIVPGVRVTVPFGPRNIKGFVVGVSEEPAVDPQRLRPIASCSAKDVAVEGQLIELAGWMSSYYGCTMNQALKTVLFSRRRVAAGRARKKQAELPEKAEAGRVELNPEQRAAVEKIMSAYPRPALLYGVTGSGKTEVYMELIEAMQRAGKQTILLIPEIALTYQNLTRFYRRFGSRVGCVNSRLSEGERYESFAKAKSGAIDVMIGPRSALFTPFENLGLIIVDEEHETAYHSDTSPRYSAVEVAVKRAELAGAGVVLGSATPSLETYRHALAGDYTLAVLSGRAKADSRLPAVTIVDLREELKRGNRSIFSEALRTAIEDRLKKKEQVMLFLNRRGFAGFVSCRSCGTVFKCPHCDVSLTAHRGGKLVCHYCGYTRELPETCPVCGSKHIGVFGLGTQKLESAVKKTFPEARTLRMDMDTTTAKDAHARMLSSFAKGEADVLIGTQMIVKGHDFPNVTLMGIMAADLSLFVDDFRAAERTFQLLTQAAGRAGRAGKEGEVIIQTYDPDNTAITAAAAQDYERFYREEIAGRKILGYPPEGAMMSVLVKDVSEERTVREAERLAALAGEAKDVAVIGPAPAGVAKIKDQFRMIFYVKSREKEPLFAIRDKLEKERHLLLQIDIL